MDDQNNPVEQVKAQDLSEMKNAQAPKKTWFFKRGDGMVFPCEEKEAWDIVNNRSEWKRRDFTLIGTSDGTTYQRIVRESRAKADALAPQVEGLKAEIARYTQMEDKIMVDEVVDMDDTTDPVNAANVAKIKRLRSILAKKREKFSKVNEEYRKLIGEMVSAAIDAEMKVAISNMQKNGPEWPGPVNIITPDASPQQRAKILKNLPA